MRVLWIADPHAIATNRLEWPVIPLKPIDFIKSDYSLIHVLLHPEMIVHIGSLVTRKRIIGAPFFFFHRNCERAALYVFLNSRGTSEDKLGKLLGAERPNEGQNKCVRGNGSVFLTGFNQATQRSPSVPVAGYEGNLVCWRDGTDAEQMPARAKSATRVATSL